MATKKSQTAKKPAPKATKTVTTASGKTKTMPAKKPATKPTPKPTANPAPKKRETGRIVACVIGFVAAVALIVITIIALNRCMQNRANPDMVAVAGNGEKLTSEYVDFLDDSFRIKIPKDFGAIDTSSIAAADTSRTILGAYASSDESISVVVGTIKGTKITNDQVATYASAMRDTFALSATIIDSKDFIKSEHNMSEMRISMKASGDSKIYEDILLFSQNDQIVMIIVTYGSEDAEKWQPVSEFITDSVEFTK